MSETTVDRKLIEIFEEAFDLFYSFETILLPINGPEFQALNKKCIHLFEDCTRLVSISGIFSSNESYTELSTNDLKYLLLPFFLGTLSQKICSNVRSNVIDIADTYFKDFLRRCSDYGFCENENESREQPDESFCSDKLEMLTKQVLQRNQKILKFRQKKELEEQINNIKLLLKKEHVDDDTKREFYIKLLKMSIIDAREELYSIAQENEILKFQQSREGSGEYFEQKPSKNVRPLKPIIITRDLAQKAVYGMGYPSLPTMTVAEFYDQRVRDGIFPDPCQSNIKQNLNENQKQQQTQVEQEDIQIEEKLEQDDEYELARLRAKDDYKDEHRRGEGNRHNRS